MLLAAAAPASAEVLVSNIGQDSDPDDVYTYSLRHSGQSFTTGSHVYGYSLTSAEVASGDSKSFTVSVCTTNASGQPEDCTAALTAPDSFSDNVLTFTAPSGGIPLAAGTTYALVFSGYSGNKDFRGTASAAEDSGGASGWSISDKRLVRSGGWIEHSGVMRIRINGGERAAPAIAEVSVTSEPQTDDGAGGRVYGLGENIELTVRFDEAVTVTGTPVFGFSLTDENAQSGNIVLATYARGSGTDRLVFAYRVRQGDSDDNGIYIWSNRLSLDGGTIRNAFDHDANLEHEAGPGSLSDHRVDGGLASAPERRAWGVPSDWGLLPEGLGGLGTGQRFRLLFVSSGTRRGDSADIEDYNAFIQGAAAGGHLEIRRYASRFRVLGCTSTVNARENTGTGSGDADAPIYWLGGEKVADDYADLYDGNWDSNSPRSESGETFTVALDVLTGCGSDGSTQGGAPLGSTAPNPSSQVGHPQTEGRELSSSGSSTDGHRNFYGLSPIFEVRGPGAPRVVGFAIASTPASGDTYGPARPFASRCASTRP